MRWEKSPDFCKAKILIENLLKNGSKDNMSVNLYSAFDMFLMDAQTNRVKETIKTYNALKTMLLEYDPRLDFT